MGQISAPSFIIIPETISIFFFKFHFEVSLFLTFNDCQLFFFFFFFPPSSSHPPNFSWNGPKFLKSSRGPFLWAIIIWFSKTTPKWLTKSTWREVCLAFHVPLCSPLFNQLTCAVLKANMILVASSPLLPSPLDFLPLNPNPLSYESSSKTFTWWRSLGGLPLWSGERMRWREKREWERKTFPQLNSSWREGTLSDVNMSTYRQECTHCTISSMNFGALARQKKRK